MIDREYKVLLPSWLLELRRDDAQQFKEAVRRYVAKGRPDYHVKAVRGSFAVCERK